ncbi:MAG: hypothetical protein ACREXV_11885 [Polaromonas sp.]
MNAAWCVVGCEGGPAESLFPVAVGPALRPVAPRTGIVGQPLLPSFLGLFLALLLLLFTGLALLLLLGAVLLLLQRLLLSGLLLLFLRLFAQRALAQ